MPEPTMEPRRSSADQPVRLDPERSMKPLLALAVREALHLALIDCCLGDAMNEVIERDGIDAWLETSDKTKEAWMQDIYAIPGKHLGGMDAGALAQNLACRLFGAGGWQLGDLYTPNATPQEVFDHSIHRPHHDAIAELAVDMGLHPHEDGER